MSKKIKWIGLTGLLVAVVAGATLLYNRLGKEYTGQQVQQNTADTAAAPDFQVENANGEAVSLKDYRGQPVVINFWASWCYYCKQEMADFEAARQQNPDVAFLMINVTDGVQETRQSADEYLAGQNFGFDTLYDTQLSAASAYGIAGLPATFFVDSQGNLVAQRRGLIDSSALQKGIQSIKEE